MEKLVKLVSFYVGNKIYGIDMGLVQEFIENIESTQLPTVHNSITGVVNLRGRIVTVADLGLIFDAKPCQKKRLLMVMRTNFNTSYIEDKSPLAFLVDDNGPIFSLEPEKLIELPDFKDTNTLHFCSHALETDKGLLSIIKPEKLCMALLHGK